MKLLDREGLIPGTFGLLEKKLIIAQIVVGEVELNLVLLV
jgi:hypothetical protein